MITSMTRRNFLNKLLGGLGLLAGGFASERIMASEPSELRREHLAEEYLSNYSFQID